MEEGRRLGERIGKGPKGKRTRSRRRGEEQVGTRGLKVEREAQERDW